METSSAAELHNAAFHLRVYTVGEAVTVTLTDAVTGHTWAEGAYTYTAARAVPAGDLHMRGLRGAAVRVEGERLIITGTLAELAVTHTLHLPASRALLEEQIALTNNTAETISISAFAFGFRRPIAGVTGMLLGDRADDRVAALPFKHKATDPSEQDMEFGLPDLLARLSRAARVDFDILHSGYAPTPLWAAEGWAWRHGDRRLGIFKFNQQALEWSTLQVMTAPRGDLWVRFGGAGQLEAEPDCLSAIAPGQTVALGVTRFVSVAEHGLAADGYHAASYAFRAWLDELGCRFPAGYNPPVHWNELYDNPEWAVGTPGTPPGPRRTRLLTYNKAMMLAEAAKAQAYGCQALYLDPGWDVEFGSLLWGIEWLGEVKEFTAEVREKFGLSVSVHCPLAAWASVWSFGEHFWPESANRMLADGTIKPRAMCQASQQYMDAAAERMLALCAGGVKFLMFDGNAWPGECWHPDHGHSVPLTYNEHCAANVALARRIHAEYPAVLIEMHDAIVSGMRTRYTPVYYGYAHATATQPASYDENWGFELMWQPMEEITTGRARALYYYNLGCNVPVYLHVDLRGDNEHALVLWWYASTCRHLGIGGTHFNPQVAALQRAALQHYREYERFFKEGEFYGIAENFHVHALRDEAAFVINIFNFSDRAQSVSGTVPFDLLGLDRDRWYVSPFTHPEGHFDGGTGCFYLNRRLPAWGTECFKVYALPAQL